MNDALEPFLKQVGGPQVVRELAQLFPEAALYVVDARQNIVFWSEGATRLTGYASDEVVGRHCLSASRCVECLSSCGLKKHEAVTGARIKVFHKDGREIPVVKHARGFFDDDGGFAGGVEVLVPRTDAAAVSRDRSLPILTIHDDDEVVNFHGLLTRNVAMKALIATVKNVARTDVTALVRGPSGSGKELVARAIHQESARRERPFLAVNCAAMSPSLLDSELFGHEKGAFTGAVSSHEGLFERAHGGTLFLDEVAEVPLDLQAKLLRVLEERSFHRVGGTRLISVDVRIISATHRSLRREVSLGRFREDLMYRLRVVPIFLPSLAERKDDVPLLVEHFISRLNQRGGRQVTTVDPDVMRAFIDYSWPGHVRELRNAIEYAFAVATGPALTVNDLPRDLFENAAPHVISRTAPVTKGDDEKMRIINALREADGNIGQAAATLGISRPTLWRKRKKFGL